MTDMNTVSPSTFTVLVGGRRFVATPKTKAEEALLGKEVPMEDFLVVAGKESLKGFSLALASRLPASPAVVQEKQEEVVSSDAVTCLTHPQSHRFFRALGLGENWMAMILQGNLRVLKQGDAFLLDFHQGWWSANSQARKVAVTTFKQAVYRADNWERVLVDGKVGAIRL